MLESANTATGGWHQHNPVLIRNQVIRILDYIDGETFVCTDVPPHTPLVADPYNVQIALLGPVPQSSNPAGYLYNDTELPPGYVYLIAIHLDSAIPSTATTPDQHRLAILINTGINNMEHWLTQVRQDAKSLLAMTSTQLLQPAALATLQDMVTQARYAYAGQLDPTTGQSQYGAVWIFGNVQRLATFDTRPYSPSA